MAQGEALPTPRRLDRTLLRPWVLLLLRDRPGHGYDLIERLRSLDLPDADGPALYRLLKELEDGGLVRSSWAPSGTGPSRRVYRVTGKGTRQLHRDAEDLRTLSADLRRFARGYRALRTRITRRRR